MTKRRKLDLVAQMEISQMAGVKASTVGVWVTRGLLPEPVAHLACGRIWLRSDIAAWLEKRNASE